MLVHISKNDCEETTDNQSFQIKEYIQPLIVDMVLIELFSDTKANDFPSEADSIDGRSSGKTFLLSCDFSFNFKNPFFLWPLPSEISLLFKADKSLILMLGCVIFWVLIIAIYAADSLTMGSVSLTILYSCWISSVSSKEKAVHLQQPRRLRHRLL